MTDLTLPTPLSTMLSLARARSRDPFTRLKSYCDLAENAARLFAVVLVAECRRQRCGLAALGEGLRRLATSGLQFGNWLALLEAARSSLLPRRQTVCRELVRRAWAWGGRMTGYLTSLKRLLRIRNAVHHSSLQTDDAAVVALLDEAAVRGNCGAGPRAGTSSGRQPAGRPG